MARKMPLFSLINRLTCYTFTHVIMRIEMAYSIFVSKNENWYISSFHDGKKVKMHLAYIRQHGDEAGINNSIIQQNYEKGHPFYWRKWSIDGLLSFNNSIHSFSLLTDCQNIRCRQSKMWATPRNGQLYEDLIIIR